MHGGKVFRLRDTTTRPADVTAYAAGDEVSNSATAGSVVRPSYDLSGFTRGRIRSVQIDLTAASGNVVTIASDFEVAVYKTPDAPAAVGDNATSPIAAAIHGTAIGVYRFDDTGWTGVLGTVAAAASQLQRVAAHVVQPLATNVPQYPWHDGMPFSFEGQLLTQRSLVVVLRVLAAWTPTGIVNTFGITLDVEAD